MAAGSGEDIVPDDESGFAFATTFEPGGTSVRLRRAGRLLVGLVVAGAALGVLIMIVVRALAVLWPKMFPSS